MLLMASLVARLDASRRLRGDAIGFSAYGAPAWSNGGCVPVGYGPAQSRAEGEAQGGAQTPPLSAELLCPTGMWLAGAGGDEPWHAPDHLSGAGTRRARLVAGLRLAGRCLARSIRAARPGCPHAHLPPPDT